MGIIKRINRAGWILIALIFFGATSCVRQIAEEYSTYTPEQKVEFWNDIADGFQQGFEAGSQN